MRIAIVGSGGLGGYFGARLAAGGADVHFMARGTHLAALRASGIAIEGGPDPIHVPRVAATDDPAQIGVAETLEVTEEAECKLPIEEADVVVAAGWGVNALGGMDLVRELADVLEGAVAGTRPLMDKGWITPDCMIGQSGKVIGPNLFISLGASGAMHFSTGFERAKFVLAVDQNPQAPIFLAADVGIVGDLREVLPPLIHELRKLKPA